MAFGIVCHLFGIGFSTCRQDIQLRMFGRFDSFACILHRPHKPVCKGFCSPAAFDVSRGILYSDYPLSPDFRSFPACNDYASAVWQRRFFGQTNNDCWTGSGYSCSCNPFLSACFAPCLGVYVDHQQGRYRRFIEALSDTAWLHCFGCCSMNFAECPCFQCFYSAVYKLGNKSAFGQL